jgi:uncharacterized linocin/CFP29 family protein
MSLFGRDLAPISEEAFRRIDEQAGRTLRANLAARKFADVHGPCGWEFSAVPAGRACPSGEEDGVSFGVRRVIPLLEQRVEFELDAIDLHNIDRGGANPDLTPVERAAKSAAAFEDRTVFGGFEMASIKGLACECVNAAMELPSGDPDAFLRILTEAVCVMSEQDSIGGPYAIAGGEKFRSALHKLTGGRSILEVIRKNTPVDEFIHTHAPDDAYLISKRGGDFELTLGQDFTVGYTPGAPENGGALKFFLTESFTFRVLEPRAYLPLKLR